VPLFQEQAMRIAIEAAKFTPGEADRLRRAMATFRRVGTIHTFQEKMVEGMVSRGYERGFAENCFRQIEGFGEYGFPESHAASFALLVYSSSWIKCHYPDVFCAGLLNAQPMGFYAPAQIVRDAREHGVEVREVDVNYSDWDATLEALEGTGGAVHARHASQAGEIRTRYAVRLGLRQVKGFREAEAALLVAARHAFDGGRPFAGVRDLWRRAGLTRGGLERLAEADAFRSAGLDRRAALWDVRALSPGSAAERLPLFSENASGGAGSVGADEARTEFEGDLQNEPGVILPAMPAGEHVINDYRTLSLSLKAHPLEFLRADLSQRGIVRAEKLATLKSGRRVSVAGLVLVRQRPGTAKGVIFATLEDETGVANIIVWPKIFERFRPIVIGARLLGVRGRLQSAEGVTHVVAESLEDLSPLLARLSRLPLGSGALAHADEVRRPVDESYVKVKPGSRLARTIAAEPDLSEELATMAKRAAAVMPKGRNFQ
jgi:error-prone DNA polymerase